MTTAVASAEPAVEELSEAERRFVSGLRQALRKLAGKAILAEAARPANVVRLAEKALREEFPVSQPDNRLANSLARGMSARRKLMEDEGGSMSAEAAAQELGLSKPAILKRYQKGRILAWREERQNAVRFPVWQFQDHKLLPGIEETLNVLDAGSRLDDFGRLLFFLSNHGFLGGKRPLDCLREGNVTKVLQAAEGYGG